ncbi:adenosylhomocysteinase [Rhizobium sp. B230/85]|uniref:adenosylhomocysteinase n=1 Tax=unclassified Rhizobium TaxID=2613769 RepID=UPI001C5B0CDE|nr:MULTISPECIES: adenosylhomocysteinase [unclassified Rhizobium]QXZ99114.1 adenosylhomocysteinase [Rhizobium sp. B230/85]
MAKRQVLPFPILLVNDVVTKWEVDNTFGTGQSTVDGILRATGKLLAGKVFVVCGFGHVGRGIALRAAGQGARVVICCRSAETAIKATLAGYEVLPLEKAVSKADILCTATGVPNVVRSEHLALAKHNITLCNTGHSVTEIDVSALEAMATARTIRTDLVTSYTLANGNELNLIARGGLVNLAAAAGNPSEVMDVTFCNQALSVFGAQFAQGALEPRLHEISDEQDEDVAARKLHAMGLRCDE